MSACGRSLMWLPVNLQARLPSRVVHLGDVECMASEKAVRPLSTKPAGAQVPSLQSSFVPLCRADSVLLSYCIARRTCSACDDTDGLRDVARPAIGSAALMRFALLLAAALRLSGMHKQIQRQKRYKATETHRNVCPICQGASTPPVLFTSSGFTAVPAGQTTWASLPHKGAQHSCKSAA